MFACGVYPAHQDFVDSVVGEAEKNVKRLAHHPSIALWCGNNEGKPLINHPRTVALIRGDYQQILQWGGVITPTFLFRWLIMHLPSEKQELPARVLYEEHFPKIVKSVCGDDVPYWPGSPYGGEGWDTSDETVGDVVCKIQECGDTGLFDEAFL
jgi:beta-mannosidase